MPTVNVVTALAGVSSLFALLSLLAYFFIGQKGQQTDSIFDVMGHRVDLELEIELIKQFKTDAAKLKALRQRHDHNDALAQAILAKIKGNVDVHHAAKSRDRRYLIAAIVFIIFAVLAVMSPIFQRAPAVAKAASWISATLTVPGCGNSGCYLTHNVCGTIPADMQGTGKIRSSTDSFSGWGEWVGEPAVTEGTVCRSYTQHSHNQTRTVSYQFEVVPRP